MQYPFCSNVAKQVAHFSYPFYRRLSVNMSTRASHLPLTVMETSVLLADPMELLATHL